MNQPVDDCLVEKAVERLGRLPGLASDVSRRESLRMMVRGLLAGVMAPVAAAGLAGTAPAHADTIGGPSRGGRFGPREELLVCYFEGAGKFSDDMRYITLNMTMFDLDGNAIGTQHGVHDSLSTLADMFAVPPTPTGNFDAPPVPVQAVKEWTKGIWTFADGSAVYAVGPARTHIVPFNDGSLLFTVTTGQTITGGLGRYANAYGVKQATGSAFVPAALAQSGHFPSPGLEFIAHTIEVFRIFMPDAS